MKEFFDREKATKEINNLLAERSTPWIVLGGSRHSGKTEFAKRIASLNKSSIICVPKYETSYAYALIQALKFKNALSLREVVIEFSKSNETSRSFFSSMGLSYVEALKANQVKTAVKALVKNDISTGLYTFAQYIAETVISDTICIFLDDFHICDYDSYIWILELWNSFPKKQPTVVAICNFELDWESSKLFSIFRGVNAPVSIERFDSEAAFHGILREHFNFENDVKLEMVARTLFKLYNGNSRMLFETVKLLQGKVAVNDDEKMELIYNTAQNIHLRSFKELNRTHLLVLRLLAYSPNPITKDNIIRILELIEPLATIIINQLYDKNLITQIADTVTGKTLYVIKDDFVKEIICEGCTSTERYFFKTKVFRAIQKGQLSANLEQTLEIALALSDDAVLDLLLHYISLPDESINTEKKAHYIDRVLNRIPVVPDAFVSSAFASMLYQYGHYHSAERVVNACLLGQSADYHTLLLLGDIQHLLLSPKASGTFKKASEINGISISDKLKAINRQIMALNQEHQEGHARRLYKETLSKYENISCEGLIELYRNTNNSFDYNEALNYTLKGCALAKKLGNDIEFYKCLHNICMIQLQYGHYGESLTDSYLTATPTFEQVLSFFSRWPEYRHERAYPLLDLGTATMFEYTQSHNPELLIQAKKYYSQAQLYAKSFYAQNIAETGLLVVNSYQCALNNSMFVHDTRAKLYSRYSREKNNIQDYRVHRKILLTLALSAIITDDLHEAVTYLSLAQPYIKGAETLRYNRLCRKVSCTEFEIEYVFPNGKYELYYGSDEIVPWLISFGH